MAKRNNRRTTSASRARAGMGPGADGPSAIRTARVELSGKAGDSLHPDVVRLKAIKQATAELTGPDAVRVARLADSPLPVIVAEGDSWFDYPPSEDIMDQLVHRHGYTIRRFARRGDTLENMVYGTEISDSLKPKSAQVEEVMEAIGQLKPAVVLFSGGGNDVAGDEFGRFLQHADSGQPALWRDVAERVAQEQWLPQYVDFVRRVLSVAPGAHVIGHGYAYAVPSGRGTKWWVPGITWAGPWLKPALVRKRVLDDGVQRQVVRDLIDIFNQTLARVAQMEPRFHHVDLRGLITSDSLWRDELHLTTQGYKIVTDRINQEIEAVTGVVAGRIISDSMPLSDAAVVRRATMRRERARGRGAASPVRPRSAARGRRRRGAGPR